MISFFPNKLISIMKLSGVPPTTRISIPSGLKPTTLKVVSTLPKPSP